MAFFWLNQTRFRVALWFTPFAKRLITFCVTRRRCEMYIGNARLCVCVSVRRRIPTLMHGPGCNLGEW